MKTSILRYGNVYGERQDPRCEAGVISIFLDRIKSGRQPVIFGDGEQTGDYVYVKDVIEATILAVEREGTYNIGTGRETSVNELVKIISKVVGREITPIYAEPRRGEVRRICLDIGRAERELRWKPKVSLEEGIEKIWKG